MSANDTWKNYVEGTEEWLDVAALESIRSSLGAIADAVVDAIQREVPEYARPLDGEFGLSVRFGTTVALRRFIGDDEQEGSFEQLYRRIGAGEYHAGRGLDALQSAYRIGARVAWRQISDAADAAGASTRAQRNLAEAMFAYIDRLAGESVEGYTEAQLGDAGELDRRRSELAEMLLAGAAAGEAELARAAELARWPLPRTVACLAISGPRADAARRGLSGEALSLRSGDGVEIILAHAPALEHEAARVAGRLGLSVGLGPGVVLEQARSSMRLARRALALASPQTPLVLADERLAEIALHAAPEILSMLAERLLAPLQGQTPASRTRLEATLLQWLRHRGAQSTVAAELAVHPQTVRYRLTRLRDLMGEALDDPESRFALEMVLRYRQRAEPAPRSSQSAAPQASAAP